MKNFQVKIEIEKLKLKKVSFFFKADTIRDSDGNMEWNESDGLLTYRQRRIYDFAPEHSVGNPKDVFVTGCLTSSKVSV